MSMWARQRSSGRFASTASVERDRSRGLAGLEIAFQTPIGRQLQAKIPGGSTTWVREHYFVEVAGVLRRAEINGRHTEAQVRVALDRSDLARPRTGQARVPGPGRRRAAVGCLARLCRIARRPRACLSRGTSVSPRTNKPDGGGVRLAGRP